MPRELRFVVGLVAALTAASGGCGDGEPQASSATSTTAPAAATPTSSTPTSSTIDPGQPTTGATSEPGGGSERAPVTVAPAPPGEREQVVADLAVDWRPESQLTEDERRQQRARIEAVQDEVVRDLGVHGSLTRRLTETAQVALAVDVEGRRILERHPKVRSVSDNRASPPAGAG